MNRRWMVLPELILGLLVAGACAWTQEPDNEGPPPPPDAVRVRDFGGPGGKFVFMGGEFAFENRLKPVTGEPFSAQAITETTQVLADGNQIKRSETAQLCRDSSGRTRHDATLTHIGPWSAAATPRRIVNIHDPVAGTDYLLDATEKTAMKIPAHAHRGNVERLRQESKQVVAFGGKSDVQRTTESLGTQVMAGITVEGTRTTETIPAGSIGNQNPIVITSERWTSPELQTVVYTKHSDPRFGTTIYQLTNISRQEPDPSLFQVPPDYTIKDAPIKEGPVVLRAKP